MTMQQLKELIRKTRQASGLKQGEVADAMKISRGHMSAVETGGAAPGLTFCDDFARVCSAPEVAQARWGIECDDLVAELDVARSRRGAWAERVGR